MVRPRVLRAPRIGLRTVARPSSASRLWSKSSSPLPASSPIPASCRSFASTSRWRSPVDAVEPSSAQATYSTSSLRDEEYHEIADTTMDSMTDYLESMIEDGGPQLRGCDVEYSSGVLTLNMAGHGIYVINKQPPNKQIWLSSPISGPKRYDFDAEQRAWFNPRDMTRLQDLLDQELTPMADAEIRVDVGL